MPAQLTLDQLVEEACAQFAPADMATRYHAAALHHAAAFRRELISGTSRMRKTAYLELSDDRTAFLPDDYTEYTMLGLQLPGWSAPRNLLYNGLLSLLPEDLQNFASDEPADYLRPPTSYECEQARYGLLDADYDGYCGYGSPCHGGEFRIDRETGRIVCSSRVPSNALLVLEYDSFGAGDGEDIVIDPLAHSWGVNFLLWKLYMQKQNLQMAREHERLSGIEKTKFQDRTRNFSLHGAKAVQHQAAAQRWK